MTLSRRRFLSLTSAACLIAPSAQAYRWQGIALGAQAQIILDHPNAKSITNKALAEINRLENIFSLHRPDSEIAKLNRAGRLEMPSFDLLQCLTTARYVYRATEGRFDPTVQPLWRVLAEAQARNQRPSLVKVEAAEKAIGFERVSFDTVAVVLTPGQQITLNGIAQGYIADRVADLMRREGIRDVLIKTGELVAHGRPNGKTAWPISISGDATPFKLTNRALATSAPLGTVLNAAGTIGHILDPRRGKQRKSNIQQVSVSANQAALADAVSTALCLAHSPNEAKRLLRNIQGAQLESLQIYPNQT